jgi:hypothetical protein
VWLKDADKTIVLLFCRGVVFVDDAWAQGIRRLTVGNLQAFFPDISRCGKTLPDYDWKGIHVDSTVGEFNPRITRVFP